MFRQIYYSSSKGKITEFHWDQEGNRITSESPFKPVCFVEVDYETKYKTNNGTYAEPKVFDNSYDRHKFIEREERKIFYNLPPEQQYAIQKYKDVDQSKFMENPVRTFYLDIECPAENEFPKAADARYEIDLMTIYDSLTQTYHMWGKREWDKSGVKECCDELGGKIRIPENIEYYCIEDEAQRLGHMLDFWTENTPDILTHWNGKSFDIPYLVNRMKLVLPKNKHHRLSPVKYVSHRDGFDRFGNPEININIHAVNDMDYMDVFKTFTFGQERESWKLNDVTSDILGCGKVKHDGTLWELSQNDWATYALYNLVDVALMVSMEEELSFLEVGRETAYEGFSNFVDCLGKIRTIVGALSIKALKSGKLLGTNKISIATGFEGGYVMEPRVGMATDLMTADIISLYPSAILGLNISPETKIGKLRGGMTPFGLESTTPIVDFHDSPKNWLFNDEQKFKEWLLEQNYCVSAAGVIFDQTTDGVVTEFVREQFANKSKYTKLMREAIEAGDDKLAKIYDRKRAITKIFVNSVYGVISAPNSPLYDIDLARSVTLTGQAVIKKSHDLVTRLSAQKFGVTDRVVVASDTDSAMIELSQVCANVGELGISMFNEDGGISEDGNKLCNLYLKLLNTKVNEWVAETLCCNNPPFFFEREKVASAALFFGKKQYAYYVNNNDGRDLPPDKRMKYTGLKVIKSEYSPMVKDMMNELYHDTLSQFQKLGKNRTRNLISGIVMTHKEKFFNAEFYDVSKRQKANNIQKYEELYTERYVSGKGCPAQVKACINHNRLVEDLGLKSKYPPLGGGTKAMWVYVKPNKWDINCVAGNGGILPEEFGLEIDYEKQFDVLYMKVYTQLFDTIGWRKTNLFYEEEVDLYDMFS